METTEAIVASVSLTSFIGVIGWSLVNVINHGNRIKLLESTWSDFGTRLQKDIAIIQNDIEKLNGRLDTLIRTEMDVLRDIAKGKES